MRQSMGWNVLKAAGHEGVHPAGYANTWEGPADSYEADDQSCSYNSILLTVFPSGLENTVIFTNILFMLTLNNFIIVIVTK